MNQILSVEMPKSKQSSYRNKSSKKADIRTIIIFFCVILILFSVIIIITMCSMKEKKQTSDNQVIAGTQPTINVEIKSETTLNIIVSHDKQISSISYNWNDEEAIEEKDIGETSKEIQVEIPTGKNTLNVNVTDINGVKQTYSNQYTGTQGPSIILSQEENKVKLTVQSDNTISYISYNWDGGEEKQIQINDVKTEQLIDILEGEHKLNIVVVDINGGEATESKVIKGDNKPTIKITSDANKTKLYIVASDDEGLTKMTIQNYDTKKEKKYEINDKQYNEEIPLQSEDKKLIITIYNVNGIKNEQRIMISK